MWTGGFWTAKRAKSFFPIPAAFQKRGCILNTSLRRQLRRSVSPKTTSAIPKTVIDLQPPIEADIFDKLRKKEWFQNFVYQEFKYEAAKAGLKPKFSSDLLHDAWQSYIWDIERPDGNMPTVPDHFKHCGYLAYWLQRHSPVTGWEAVRDAHKITKEEDAARDLIFSAGRAYHAFSLGYRICFFFEQNKESEIRLPRPINADYIRHISYYMKYKNVSPHAMGLVYRSLFWV